MMTLFRMRNFTISHAQTTKFYMQFACVMHVNIITLHVKILYLACKIIYLTCEKYTNLHVTRM